MKSARKLLSLIFALLLVCPLLASCGSSGEYRDYSYFAMDTYVTIRLAQKSDDGKRLSSDRLSQIAEECAAIIDEIDGVLSAHDPASDVYALNSEINKMLSADQILLSVMDTAKAIHSLTGGTFDYTLGSLTSLWNVNGGGPVPSDEAIAEALSHTGTKKFSVSGTSITKLDSEAKLDFGGIGKGYATQKVLEYLATTEVAYGIVSLGGNIGVYGEKPEYGNYKIGINDPQSEDSVLGYLYLTSGFVSVSGNYERYFEENGQRYHHILDPRTGYPADSGLTSVAVHTPNGSSADALSTALFVLGVEKSLELYESGSLDFEAVFVSEDGTVTVTPGLADRFELVSKEYALPEA